MLKTLAVAGVDANSAMSIAWSAKGDDKLKFTVSWQAEFLPATD